MFPIINFIGNLGYVGICILGGYLAVNGKLSVGDIQAFIQYTRQFINPLTQVANISSTLQQTAAATERIFEFLEAKEEDPDVENSVSIENIQGKVEFKNVHFGYDEGKTVINDFSAKVNTGQKIAIVGPTGARKNYNCKITNAFL